MALRLEPFGALAYHLVNRKLTFLKRPELVSVIRGLQRHDNVRSALVEAGIPETQWPAYESALRHLAAADMVRPSCREGWFTVTLPAGRPAGGRLVEQFEYGLDAPICLTWELTYACNLACAHCLSSSGRRDPRELTTAQCEAVIDELQRMQVFYINVGGGEPTIRDDFWHLLEYAVDSSFHLAAFGEKLPRLNLCGAGRVVCLIDPVGDVYACPFAIHDSFLAGNVLADGGFQRVWRTSVLFKGLRSPQTSGACTGCQFFDSCRGGCMAAKFFTGSPGGRA